MTMKRHTTTRAKTTTRGFLAAAFLTTLAASPALASHGFPGGPVFTSPKAIAEAQAILEKDDYLKAGSYKQGDLDQQTINAIRQFQRNHFLRPTGQLEPDTMGLLSSHWTIGGSSSKGRASAAGSAGIAPGGSVGSARYARASGATMTDHPSLASGPAGRAASRMPQTGSPFVLEVFAGAVLLAGGMVLLRRHAA
jgi:LPXTG-motif cell wall-anchored protein